MKENEFVKFMTSFLESALEGEKLKPSKDISEKMAESFKRMESKRKESLFTDLWNKECLMDIISDEESNIMMEVHSVYYISDEDGKRVVFDISFNEYENRKYIDCERYEFIIKFCEKDGKADFERIFAKLYYEIQELYERKVISIKTFSDFVGFNIERFFSSYKPKDKSSSTIDNNTVCGDFAPSNKEVENKGNEMKDLKQMVAGILGISEEKLNEIVESSSKKISMEKLNKLVDDAVSEIKGIKIEDFAKGFSEVKETVKPEVEKVKEKAGSVFETIAKELKNTGEDIKGSFNAMKDAVKNKIKEDKEKEEASEHYNVTLTALEVFVANKVEINEHILQTIERYKQSMLGRTIEIIGLNKDEDVSLVVTDTDFTDMLEVYLSEDGFIDDETNIKELEFVTTISFEGVEDNSYIVAKMSVGEMMDIFVKFVPTDYDIISE